MIFEIIWEPVALNLATRFLADDQEGLSRLIEATDALSDEPRPQSAARLGASDPYRLRLRLAAMNRGIGKNLSDEFAGQPGPVPHGDLDLAHHRERREFEVAAKK